jgi:hypothetical protein
VISERDHTVAHREISLSKQQNDMSDISGVTGATIGSDARDRCHLGESSRFWSGVLPKSVNGPVISSS